MTRQPYQVHGTPGTRLTRVTWMLEELGAPYEINSTRLGTRDLQLLSPSLKGPVLVDDDLVLTDSAAICFHLAKANPEAGLGPADAKEEALMLSWLFFTVNEFEAPMWIKRKHEAILPEAMRLDVSDWVARDFKRECNTLHRRLGDQPFAMGDRFTCADVLLGHCGGWARRAGFAINSDTVNAYLDRILGRPALARAKEREAASKSV